MILRTPSPDRRDPTYGGDKFHYILISARQLRRAPFSRPA